MAADHFCLRWNNYQSNMVSELDILRTEEHLVDVTLCCEGHKFRAHKVILSACSPYFRNVFKENPCEHPVVILKDVSPEDVEALLSFVYQGVVYVSEKKLSSFLQTAELLQIKGLAGAASSFMDEQTKAAVVGNSRTESGGGNGGGGGGTPVKRRKGVPPVRIVKPEDEDQGDSNQTGGGDEGTDGEAGIKQEWAKMADDELGEDSKQDDEGSIGEESGSEASGDINATTYASVDLREEGGGNGGRERGGGGGTGDQMATLLQQTLARARVQPQPQQQSQPQPQQTLDTTLQGQFQVPVPNQGLPELLSPTADRNGRRPCPLCTKVISNKSNLLKHMRIRHSDVYNPACCLLCNKLFKNKYSLRAHLNIYHKQQIAPNQQQQAQQQQQVQQQVQQQQHQVQQQVQHMVPPSVQQPQQHLPPTQMIAIPQPQQLGPPIGLEVPQQQYLSGV